MEQARTATAVSQKDCTLYMLNKRELDELFDDYPNERTLFLEVAQNRLVFTNLSELLPYVPQVCCVS